ncbi:MAG TPA: alpha/beta fold hydrolase [Actinomycetota bacterium]|jgi:pimeloyl-ACP methyl ester carboxylesterase|nr:alpha/beta fold hydrolase [Actinomycetota bacterium]
MSPVALLSQRFGAAASPFAVHTGDDVRLVGTRLGTGPPLVLCHGFFGWHRKPRIAAMALALSRWFMVYAFDFRGHGRSGGLCTYGDLEYLDVDAVVRLATEEARSPIVTVGISMGGIAVIRHAALRGGLDAVVAISTPARWNGHGSRAVKRIRRMTDTRGGRRLAGLLGVRLSETWSDPEDPEALVGRIAPTPLILVHGRDDHFFDEDEAWRLFRRAGQPKRLMLARRFGHAEDGLTPALAELLARRVMDALGRPFPEEPSDPGRSRLTEPGPSHVPST